ncbi:hypothetical protein [Bradyrhizobium sp. Cp5.3]|uniref:hypothetical protein n=1 Tax=Bradyrhizobium sp. Cp5.3 TaxID=443598 RepID=UPI0012EB0ED7|nr:hypothetical protein [Bradyrhizobium sp. Cp5.3]
MIERHAHRAPEDQLCLSVNGRETASSLGNFFRITFFEPSDFFESVSRDERDFESRVNFFRRRAA